MLKLPGVGPRRAEQLHALGLLTIKDVLFSYPRDYRDYRRVLAPDQVSEGDECLVYGPLHQLQEKTLPGNRRVVQGRLQGEHGAITVSWFAAGRGRRKTHTFRQLSGHTAIWVYGRVKQGFGGREIANGDWYSERPAAALMPIYPLVHGIAQNLRHRWIRFALEHVHEVYECLPAQYLQKFMGRSQALTAIHFPKDAQERAAARRRLAFEEFFLFQLGLRNVETIPQFVQHQPDGDYVQRLLDSLPFPLTPGQREAMAQIAGDMQQPRQMRRLLQGDVGSGKTVVAFYAAAKAADSQGQTAIMVPTDILARQMHARAAAALAPLGMQTALLAASISAQERARVQEGLAAGTIDVVVGTHALLTESVRFQHLTLAVVDEQHRFGVRQRLALSDKGHADLLVMSATPIPRSLALTMYGDLDTTIIPDKPVGRMPVDTRLIHPRRRDDVYRFIKERVHRGEQAFVVFPLVEESDKVEARAVVQEVEYLRRGPLASIRVGSVHGKMGKEKEQVMQAFAGGELDVLVATTVVEVGVNVPNATVMVVENADRFGLAQLHQLRGRVGRSAKQAFCFLLADPKSENGRSRLQVIRRTEDGLAIAEEDLQIRGPGDLLGVRQSGEPWFRLADIQQDRPLLEEAVQAARELLAQDPMLSNYPTLRRDILAQQP